MGLQPEDAAQPGASGDLAQALNFAAMGRELLDKTREVALKIENRCRTTIQAWPEDQEPQKSSSLASPEAEGCTPPGCGISIDGLSNQGRSEPQKSHQK
jgi:hypothetical protein